MTVSVRIVASSAKSSTGSSSARPCQTVPKTTVDTTRRAVVTSPVVAALPFGLLSVLGSTASPSIASTIEAMPALKDKNYGKSRTIYPDFTLTESGLQYKDLASGSGDATAKDGSMVVVDWSGVTIGYYGRIFEARNKPKGGSFTGDEKDFFRFSVGDDKVIPAFNEALRGMKVGGIRRIIVPPEIGYPKPDQGFKGYKPEPGSFSGKRTLDFVLENQGMMDKTLLFDIELLKIVKP